MKKFLNVFKFILGSLKCLKNGHTLEESVSCPFTGKSYRGCSVCGEVITQ
jgi:hypothetical protein